MDFFGAQDQARRATGRLVALFAMAVIAIIAVVYFAVMTVMAPEPGAGLWSPSVFLTTAGGVALVVGGASLIRTAILRSGGGRAVAEMVGGRLVEPESSDRDERRLYNVVEEMAIAAGTPVPSVYVLDGESGLNAFAAGYSSEDAVVAVTRGALQTLTRDELQAVVAHEFSHIVNRDIRLNIRLTGVLFGILALGLGGRMLLRSTMYSGGGRRDGRAMAVMVAVGLALFIAGYLGVFFGRLIRAAVSRQREFLADAAAVQFTRNPDAMVSTLKKIGAGGSRLESASAEEVSHFFFANGLRSGAVSNLWSTHPPLVERIRRLEPSFDGDFSSVSLERPSEPAPPPRRERGRTGAGRPSTIPGMPGLPGLPGGILGGAALAAGAAALHPEPAPRTSADDLTIDYTVLDQVPAGILAAAHEPFGAVALTYALILDRSDSLRKAQLEVLQKSVLPPIYQEVERLLDVVDSLPEDARLPLVDLSAPALARLSAAQSDKLSQTLSDIARADRKLSLHEFAMETAVRHRLAATHGRAGKGRTLSLKQVTDEAVTIISALAHSGAGTPEQARASFRAGIDALAVSAGSIPACTSEDVRAALERLVEAREQVRAQVMHACIVTARHDRRITSAEATMLRAIAAALDMPAPAFLASATLTTLRQTRD